MTSPQEREYICPHDDCPKCYRTLSHLKRHFSVHEGRIRCPVESCERTFKSKNYLKKHLDVFHHHKKPKKYKCSLCDTEFSKHNWLQSHMYNHTGLKPHKCPVEGCDKRFLYPRLVRRHMKAHQGYACDKSGCNKTFPNWSMLRSHVAVEHPKNYTCDICKRTFSRISNLKAHHEIHKFLDDREVFPCPKPKCQRFYSSKRNLAYHIKSYHDACPFVCSEETCTRAFKTEKDLMTHSFRHDPNKRIRKKRKKPSFAAKLSGCIKKRSNSNAKLFTKEVQAKDEEISNKDEEIHIADQEGTTKRDEEMHIEDQDTIAKTDKGMQIDDQERTKVEEIDQSLQTLIDLVFEKVKKEAASL